MGLEIFERGELPRWAPVRQFLDAAEIGDVRAAVAEQLGRPGVSDRLRPGQRVAITAGSRGIDRIDEVVRAVVDEVCSLGAEPFVIPAMGSHGGATAEGQRELIAHYGITEATMGCPILSSMDTVHLGEVEDGVPVWFDRNAFEADAVIPVVRVKPHTDFRGPVESGLMKMIAIGLGKQKGAEFFHSQGMNEFHHLIPAVSNFTLSQVNIPFGVAVIENGYGKLAQAEAVPAARMWEREQELLKIARERMGRLPGERIDVLIIDRIGKDISGDGADPNVINRDVAGVLPPTEEPMTPRIQRIIVRDLTDDTEGNATGIGMADIALRRAVERMDPVATYMNMITAKAPQGARIPLTVDTDRQALYVALACCLKTDQETARIARIQDTKHVETFWASEHLIPELLASGRVEVTGELRPIAFDANGMLLD
ncbi:MAG: lactate racemase domain-containing protein [Thermomicrobiales bacterium]